MNKENHVVVVCHGRNEDNRVCNSDNLVSGSSKNIVSLGESSGGVNLALVRGESWRAF